MTKDRVVFGFADFAPALFAKHEPGLRLAFAHSQFANRMLARLPSHMNREEIVVYMLVRMTLTGWVELLLLAGNGAGLGAMKIARGMFETAVMAEYLRRNSNEISDYLEYGHVLQFKRIRQFKKAVSTEQLKQIEKEYLRVKPRFEEKGQVRNHWNKNSIYKMAVAVGRKDHYDVSYSLAASIHHGNFEALTA